VFSCRSSPSTSSRRSKSSTPPTSSPSGTRRSTCCTRSARSSAARSPSTKPRRRSSSKSPRRSARADRLGDFDEDRLRGFVEGDRAAEDLADRVQQVDLLVPLGELVGGVLDFERRLEVLG